MANKKTRTQNVTELIAAARAENPSITAEQIGKRVGLTRQRVSQLIKDMNLPGRLTQSKAIGKLGLHSESKNLVAELAVAQDLIERGYAVYRAMTNGNNEYDLIAGRKDGSLVTIDVKLERIPGKSRIDEDSECNCVAAVRAGVGVDMKVSYKISYNPEIESAVKKTV